MSLSKELEEEFKSLQAAIQKFLEIHKNPHDTSQHDEIAQKVETLEQALAKATGSSSSSSDTSTEDDSSTGGDENKDTQDTNIKRSISASVGKGGANKEEDVRTVQQLLNKNGASLEVDGKVGNGTINAIKNFQRRLGMTRPDGVISPGKNTFKGLLGEVPVGPPSTGISSIIQGGESGAAGYNAYNRGTVGNKILGPNGPRKLVDMTIGQIKADQNRSGNDPKRLFAVGKYQMIPTTLKEGVRALNISDATKFSPETQELLFSDYLLGKKRPAIRAYIQGTGSARAAQIAGAQEWASIADPRTGRSFYDGVGGNSAHITAEDFLAALDEAKAAYKKNVEGGMSPDDAYRKAVAGIQGEAEGSGSGDNSGSDNTDNSSDDTGSSSSSISGSVGQGGDNNNADVKLVQQLLNKKGASLEEDGAIGSKTINAIKKFQESLGMSNPDGLIEPGGRTWKGLSEGSSTDGNDDNGGTDGSTDGSDDNGGTDGSTDGSDDNGGTDGSTGDGSLTSLKEEVEKAREAAREALGTVPDTGASSITMDEAEKAKIVAYVAKADEFLQAHEGAEDADKGAFDSANPGYVAKLKQSRDWNANVFLPKTEGGNDDNGGDDNTGDDNSGTPTPGANISGSVGRGGDNNEADVRTIQELLKNNGESVTVDGKIGPNTIAAIESIQSRLGMGNPDGLVEPGKNTFKKLVAGNIPAAPKPSGKYFSHPKANQVKLSYGSRAVRLNVDAAHLIKSILASVNIFGATITSTLRTYHDQARITKTQTLPGRGAGVVAQWYGQAVLDATRRLSVDELAKWWANYDKSRGRVSSRHLSGIAMDVVPNGSRSVFARKVQELVPVSGSGVRRIIPKGVMGEPVDHVEFTFQVTNKSAL